MTPQERKVMELALELATMHYTDGGYSKLRTKVRQLAQEALAQPEQEPVTLTNTILRRTSTPPQRKPLTDEQLMIALLMVDPETKRLPSGFRAFARAIEAAHGIGDKA